MHAFTALSLALATLTAAAPTPAALDKRISASITLFDGKSYGGASYTQSFTVDEPTCIAATLPGSIDNKASSVKLDGDLAHFNCRLFANQNCQAQSNSDNTWFFNWNIPDLSSADYSNIENRVRSIQCGPVA